MIIRLTLRELLNERGITMSDLANISGVRYATIHKYCHEPANINLSILATLAVALNVTDINMIFEIINEE